VRTTPREPPPCPLVSSPSPLFLYSGKPTLISQPPISTDWAIEFANQHPQVQIVGTDLSPIQPDYVPLNCTFYIDDATHDWAFHQRFDYIHVRALTMGIADWPRLIDQAYRFLQPGGYLELQEFHIPLESPDGSVRPGSALARWGDRIRAACARLGIDSMASLQHPARLAARGFAGVEERRLSCPLGPWAKGQRQKRLGWMGRKDLYEGIEGISKKLLVMMGGESEEVDSFLEECKAELMDPAVSVFLVLLLFLFLLCKCISAAVAIAASFPPNHLRAKWQPIYPPYLFIHCMC
jgi:SAM-dependent methyltransferase